VNEHVTEVWAQLVLADADAERVRAFLCGPCGLKPQAIVRRMHVTVYHARRPMTGVVPLEEPANVVVAAHDTRFMVMAPGGENPRPEFDPGRRTVGIRVRRPSNSYSAILDYRKRLLRHETQSVLGGRRPSTHNRSAFGARYFQPHMALLRPGSGVARDLSRLGVQFREGAGELTFDRFLVDIVQKPRVDR
jgi:hypothetical protein